MPDSQLCRPRKSIDYSFVSVFSDDERAAALAERRRVVLEKMQTKGVLV
ncbi:MAG: hypothetical protein ACJ8AI_06585 [Rhodopila sp.]|jgi:hypothetical protein